MLGECKYWAKKAISIFTLSTLGFLTVGSAAACSGSGEGDSSSSSTTEVSSTTEDRPPVSSRAVELRLNSGRGIWVGPYAVEATGGVRLVRPIGMVDGDYRCETIDAQTLEVSKYLVVSSESVEQFPVSVEDQITANPEAGSPVVGLADCISTDQGQITTLREEGGALWTATDGQKRLIAYKALPEEDLNEQLMPIAA